jgi:hypothetical protein
MADNEFGSSSANNDRFNNEREVHEPANDAGAGRTDEYELTAKDAGWHTPTLLVSPADFVYFDPPIPKRHREN